MELVNGGDLFDYILTAGYLSKWPPSYRIFTHIMLAEDRAGPLTAALSDAMAVCLHQPDPYVNSL